jgi:ATP-dependent DNA ligase
VLKGVAKKAEVFEVGVGIEGRERTEISEKVEDMEGEVKREGGEDSEWVEDEGEYIEVTWPIAAYQLSHRLESCHVLPFFNSPYSDISQ